MAIIPDVTIRIEGMDLVDKLKALVNQMRRERARSEVLLNRFEKLLDKQVKGAA